MKKFGKLVPVIGSMIGLAHCSGPGPQTQALAQRGEAEAIAAGWPSSSDVFSELAKHLSSSAYLQNVAAVNKKPLSELYNALGIVKAGVTAFDDKYATIGEFQLSSDVQPNEISVSQVRSAMLNVEANAGIEGAISNHDSAVILNLLVFLSRPQVKEFRVPAASSSSLALFGCASAGGCLLNNTLLGGAANNSPGGGGSSSSPSLIFTGGGGDAGGGGGGGGTAVGGPPPSSASGDPGSQAPASPAPSPVKKKPKNP